MTIQQALDHIDECKPNMFSYAQKLFWLNEADMQVYTEIISQHEGLPEGYTFTGYNLETDPDTVLLVPDVYADLYQHALARKMDWANGETDKYNTNTILFNTRFQELGDYWTRTHMPKMPVKQFSF